MKKILLAGLINIETTLKVDAFPLEYQPVLYPFFGIHSSISGVGYNIAKSLCILGNQVSFLSMIGNDTAGRMVQTELDLDGIRQNYIISNLDHTPQSVIIYDRNGKRQIHVDLKNIQDTSYPEDLLSQALPNTRLAVLCNINFSRPFLKKFKGRNIPIATDVHAISDSHDPYNRDYMEHATILFMSHEALPCSPEEWALQLQKEFRTPIIVIGLGSEGALLADLEKPFLQRFPAIATRRVVNTIGAGDALFSSFLHFFLKSGDAATALKKAMVFASYKIGETGAAQGFLSESALEKLFREKFPS